MITGTITWRNQNRISEAQNSAEGGEHEQRLNNARFGVVEGLTFEV